MSGYSYTSPEPQEEQPSGIQLVTEMGASFVPGLNLAQALRDYKRSVASKDIPGAIMGALGTIPGVGAAAKGGAALKAMLYAGALRKDLRLANSSMGHATPTGKLLPEIHNLSQAIAKDGVDASFGHSILVPKLGKFDPVTHKDARIYRGDRESPMAFDPRPSPQTEFSSFKDFETNPRGADWLRSPNTGDHNSYSELKLPGNTLLTPDNFEGMLLPKYPNKFDISQVDLDPRYVSQKYVDALRKNLDKRGLKHQLFEDSSELPALYDKMQGM